MQESAAGRGRAGQGRAGQGRAGRGSNAALHPLLQPAVAPPSAYLQGLQGLPIQALCSSHVALPVQHLQQVQSIGINPTHNKPKP